jgi:WD40 repeat protein
VPNNTGTGVFAGLGDERAWHVDLGGLSSISFTSTTELVGAAHLFGDRLYFAGSQGEILCTGESVNAVLTLDVSPSLGLVTSPDQLGFVHIGGRTATVFRLEGTILAQVAQIQVDFDIYCCAYRSNLNICFAGAQGRIAVLDLADSESPVRHIASIGAHINAMTISPDGRTLFCGGQSGLLAAVSIDGGAPPSLIPKRRPQTAAGVRAALIDFAGDEIIRQFIFAPDTLEAPLRDKLEKTTGYSSILSCVLMPGSPILAAGTDESTVILFDTRDWQIIQQIDMTSGFPTVVTGLIFTADLNLVAMDASGQILFLGQLKQSGNFVS